MAARTEEEKIDDLLGDLEKVIRDSYVFDKLVRVQVVVLYGNSIETLNYDFNFEEGRFEV